MQRALSYLFRCALLVLAACAIQRFCRAQTDSFAVSKICSPLAPNPDWETSPPKEGELVQIKKILQQPYSYLGKGAQCYVFLSQDGESVVKFFRLNHLLPPFWAHLSFPFPLQAYCWAKILQKEEELDRDFVSYKIAWEKMREETGVLFVHLNKSDNLHQSLTIVDKLQIAHELDLDKMEFLVQKRADLLYPALDAMAKREGEPVAQEALTRLVDLLVLRCKRGIHDKDPDLNTNFGFIGHTPVQIDVGRYRKGEGEGLVDRNEILRITDHLNQWLRANHPHLAEHLDNQIAAIPHA